MPSSAPDRWWMQRALHVAERGRGTTAPNPLVGAVVVSREQIVVGQGAHRVAGGPHAEIHALRAAGEQARGATLYCTLEPCCHTGRTGPCTEAVIASGVSRVVTAIEDPNPRVAGRGHAALRAAGIDVETGVMADEAGRQNAPFLTWMRTGRPWTMLKAAVTADGRMSSTHVTGPVTDRRLHRQRAWIDALVVGAGTVLEDDPQLTPRGAFRARPLVRVVVDWRGRVPPTAAVYSTLSTGPVIMVGLETVSSTLVAALQQRGVDVALCATRDIRALAAQLGARQVQSLLVEGGPGLHQAWAEAGVVDAAQVVRVDVPGTSGPPMAPAMDAWLAGRAPTHVWGTDVVMEGTWS